MEAVLKYVDNKVVVEMDRQLFDEMHLDPNEKLELAKIGDRGIAILRALGKAPESENLRVTKMVMEYYDETLKRLSE